MTFENIKSATHSAHLMDGIFELVESGKKKLEVRINRGKFANVKVGDTIKFHNTAGTEVAKVVVAISKLKSIEDVVAQFEVEEMLPGYTVDQALQTWKKIDPDKVSVEFGILVFELA